MIHHSGKPIKLSLLLALLFCTFGQTASLAEDDGSQAERIISIEDARSDIDQIVEIILNTHPDLSYSADLSAINRLQSVLKEEIHRPVSARELWRISAQLNPLLSDAHVGLRYPADLFNAYVEAGGLAFPVPVIVDDQHRMLIDFQPRPESGIRPNSQITYINEIPTSSIVNELLPRMRGETDNLRRLVMSRHFAGLFWTLYGGQNGYTVTFLSPDGESRTVSLTDTIANSEQTRFFEFDWLAGGIAYLDIRSFDRSLVDEFSSFLEQSFATIDQAKADTLFIDLRENGGGAHDVSDLIVPYLTDQSLSPTSALKARIDESNHSFVPTAVLGDVVDLPFSEPIEVTHTKPPFEGEVYLLISQNTYSQAIVFATMLKDYQVATIVGEPTSGNANQTGQVISQPLTHSGLLVASPIYIIYRPNGDRSAGSLTPDIPLEHDRAAPTQMIDSLIEQLSSESSG